VDVVNGCIVITHATTGKQHTITYTDSPTPSAVDWKQAGAEIMLDCSGVFLDRAALLPYFDGGMKKVVVSAPVKDPVPVLNIVYGVNHQMYNPETDAIVTAASCTTNCLAPVVKVVQEKVGIVHGCITTVHNITNTQTLVDAPNKKKSDLRRAR
jgi:glyceraldehyde 3-phosphate dehydrogenase